MNFAVGTKVRLKPPYNSGLVYRIISPEEAETFYPPYASVMKDANATGDKITWLRVIQNDPRLDFDDLSRVGYTFTESLEIVDEHRKIQIDVVPVGTTFYMSPLDTVGFIKMLPCEAYREHVMRVFADSPEYQRKAFYGMHALDLRSYSICWFQSDTNVYVKE